MGDAGTSFMVRGVLQTRQRGALNIGARMAATGRIAEKFNRDKQWISYCGIGQTISDETIEKNCPVRRKEKSNPTKLLAPHFASFVTSQPVAVNGKP